MRRAGRKLILTADDFPFSSGRRAVTTAGARSPGLLSGASLRRPRAVREWPGRPRPCSQRAARALRPCWRGHLAVLAVPRAPNAHGDVHTVDLAELSGCPEGCVLLSTSGTCCRARVYSRSSRPEAERQIRWDDGDFKAARLAPGHPGGGRALWRCDDPEDRAPPIRDTQSVIRAIQRAAASEELEGRGTSSAPPAWRRLRLWSRPR
jgi:hypothetical protein